MKNKVCLLILDGIGKNTETHGNAVTLAPMKNYENIRKNYPTVLVKANGLEVGLSSDKDAGNSEVGHNAIGSGKTIEQGVALIDKQINKPETYAHPVLQQAIKNTQNGKKLHLIGLVSNGRVHSDIAHLFTILDNLEKQNTKSIKIHALLDGRDVAPQSALVFIKELEDKISQNKNAELVTAAGRNKLVMDRYETNLDLIKNAYDVYVQGNAPFTNDIYTEISKIYKENPNITDENILPFIINKTGNIENGDGVILFNFRGDRAIEICELFDNFKYVDESKDTLNKCLFIGLMQYDAEANLPKNFLINPPQIENTLTELLCSHNIKQYSITETVKFGHLTYFFNGNRREPFNKNLETWEEIKSWPNPIKDPKMQAQKITDKLIEEIKSGNYIFYKANIPNGDMVGHSGNLNDTIIACREVDTQIQRIYEACKQTNTTLIITADHGNAEEMLTKDNTPVTKHTANLVWFTLISNKQHRLQEGFGLTNIASTICDLLEIKPHPSFNPSIITK